MLIIQVLERSSLLPYLLLVKPGMRQFVRDAKEDDSLLVLGASFWGEPAGVAVALQEEKAARLLDLYVLPAYRRSGIGAALLSAMQAQLVQRGVAQLQAIYRPNEHTPFFERLLAALGWVTPVLRRKVFWSRCAVAFGPWVDRYRFRPPYELFSWPELTQRERLLLAERSQTGWYPPALSPFYRPDDFWDPQSSIGLRYNGQVVGWCLTVREKPDQMLVDILFVDPPLQGLGRGFMLVGEVMRRYCASGGDYAYWRVMPDNEPMLRWSRRAFQNALADEYDEWYSEKTLKR